MNKIKYPAVIVVEGASDKSLLDSFMETEIVITNGSDVPCETISYLKELSKKTNIVVLTDPDSPGKRIRDVLDQNIPGLFHAFIPKEKAIKGHKVGVAECDKETILEALNNAMPPLKEKTEGSLTMKDLFELGIVGNIDSSIKRDLLGQKFHVGYCNGKTILKRLNALEITKEDLRKALHE